MSLPRRVLAEFLGGLLLVALGVSAMIVVDRAAAPLLTGQPGSALALSVLVGLAFGYTVTLVVYSPVGRMSGQFNPSFSVVHWLAGRQSGTTTLIIVVAQLAGGVLGAQLLRLWGRPAADFTFGATLPLTGVSLWWPVVAELLSTMVIAAGVVAIADGRVTGRMAFHLVPVLYGVLAPVIAPLSGMSTNPARTLGPALVADRFDHLWLYLVVPPLGAALGLLVSRIPALRHRARPSV